MRASTLFAVILSLLIGLGAAAGARYAGLFDRKDPEPLVLTPERPPLIRVLVATQNLFPGIHVQANQVTSRELRADEKPFWDANKAKMLPAVASAAHLRMPKVKIIPDTILTSDLLEEATIPEEPSHKLPPDYRLVNVAVSKQKSAGGFLRVGEIVDVLLTARVSVLGKGDELKQTTIARGCKIVVKRDNLFTILRADPGDKPIEFTLQTNLYRASLIDYASWKGVISLQPAPGPGMMMTTMEDQMKIAEMNAGNYAVGDEDLRTLFKLTPTPASIPPETTRILRGNAPAYINTFPSLSPPPVPQWYSIGTPGSSGMRMGGATALMVNPTTGVQYDPNDTNDPNNPNCKTCKKPPVNQPKN